MEKGPKAKEKENCTNQVKLISKSIGVSLTVNLPKANPVQLGKGKDKGKPSVTGQAREKAKDKTDKGKGKDKGTQPSDTSTGT